MPTSNIIFRTVTRGVPALLGLLFLGVVASSVSADQFTSSSFIVNDPVLAPALYSASASFRLQNLLSQIGIGTSTSSLFGLKSGFLYFPYVTSPIVTASAGNAQVGLSWTGASAGSGWTVGSYDIGQATVSGGPYSYSNVGIVTSSTVTGLTNGTTYYFVIRVKDALGNVITTSAEASAAPAGAVVTPPSSGGGGGGGSPPSSSTGGNVVTFSGYAYPRSKVTLLKDAQIIGSTIAGVDAVFQMRATSLAPGTYLFSVYGEDKDNIRSALVTFPITVIAASIDVTGIFIGPSIAVDKIETKRGDDVTIFGQAVPKSDIVISIHSDEELFAKTVTDAAGVYLYAFDTSPLELGMHAAKSKATIASKLISGYGATASFKVGTQNILANKDKKMCPTKADVNGDCKVNLVDFSIVAYWWRRTLTVDAKTRIDSVLKADGKIDLADFSILAYYWTG